MKRKANATSDNLVSQVNMYTCSYFVTSTYSIALRWPSRPISLIEDLLLKTVKFTILSLAQILMV